MTVVGVRIGDLLRAAEIDPVDARALLRYLLGATDAQIAAAPERELTAAQAGSYRALAVRRRAGEPLAYLTGEREFYSIAFQVTRDVLVPRPETELLVDLALERLRLAAAPRVLDLATGSGCVAVAIARNRPGAQVSASDVSRGALDVARENARRHRATIEFIESNWLDALGGRVFDLIVANPPYVAAQDPHLQEEGLSHEPLAALVAGPTGYECIEIIVAQAPRHLAGGGWLLVEHGYDQAASARARLQQSGFRDVFSARDLAGIERVSGGRV